MAIISLDDLKTALGIPLSNTTRDDQLNAAVNAASTAVLNYTDRDFGLGTATEQRTYEYDGSGVLDIDDCTAVTAVTLSYNGADTVLPPDQWNQQPYGSGIITHILLPMGRYGGSPDMGFTRNLDVYAREGYTSLTPTLAKVDATFGWPQVPNDVKQAAIWIAAAMAEDVRPFISETIEGYSRTVGPAPRQAIPSRALDLLVPYQRFNV